MVIKLRYPVTENTKEQTTKIIKRGKRMTYDEHNQYEL
jgi:hypothetical protein